MTPMSNHLCFMKISEFCFCYPTGIYDDWSLDSDVAKKVRNGAMLKKKLMFALGYFRTDN